ncbi:MAG: nitroreductase family protein [Eubacterium sp.]|nr:nitroreductase family protein [Eubacterium sp.]
MEFADVIRSRQSVREYSHQKIQRSLLKELCVSGLAAPSANNKKPCEFIVIEDREKLIKLSSLKPQWSMLKQAAAAILVLGRYDKYFQQNCAAATENILLDATSRQIGSVWLGLYPNKDIVQAVKELFKLPETIEPFCFVSLGYPQQNIQKYVEYDFSKIYFEAYNKNA